MTFAALDPLAIWPGMAPGSEGWAQVEGTIVQGDQTVLRNVVTPTLQAFLPDPSNATGAGIVIAPGGGLRIVAIEHEGTRVAEWFAERGVAAFVLKYRVADTGPTEADFGAAMQAWFLDPSERPLLERMTDDIGPLSLADAHKALALVRERADEWGVDVDRLGFLGFSAGGYLAVEVALAEDAALRPTFVAPIYPGLSGHRSVPVDAPPLFTAVAEDDPICVECTRTIVDDWNAGGRPAELHTYPSGGHGFGLIGDGRPTDEWIVRCHEWLGKLDVLGG